MARIFTLFALLAALAPMATAGDDEDRLRAAAREIASREPEVRARGRLLLGKLAEERTDLVRQLCSDADPEVAGTAREVLSEHGYFAEPVSQKRFHDLLDQLTTSPDMTPEGRRAVFRELLDLGSTAARILQNELESPGVEPVPFSCVVEAGKEVHVVVRMKNTGKQGVWYQPRDFSTEQRREAFGSRGMAGEGRHIMRFGCGGKQTPEERVLAALAALKRVPPGEEFELGSVDVQEMTRGIVNITTTAIGSNAGSTGVEFFGVPISGRPAEFPGEHEARVAVVGRKSSPRFDARIIAAGPDGRPALEIVAKDAAPEQPDRDCDPFWWVAEDAKGGLLGFGPMRPESGPEPEWKVGETRTVSLPSDPPAGTRRLWLGFDAEAMPESGLAEMEQAIPAPLAIEAPAGR